MWRVIVGSNNLVFGLEEENGLKVEMRKGEYVDWKFLKIFIGRRITKILLKVVIKEDRYMVFFILYYLRKWKCVDILYCKSFLLRFGLFFKLAFGIVVFF